MASNRVDFPVPFSPTMNVTGMRKVSSFNRQMAGILVTYESSLTLSQLMRMRSMYMGVVIVAVP